MPDAHAFLVNLALVLCVAALTTWVFQRIRQPVVFGYLIAGMIVGPHVGIPLLADRTMIATLSELGVVMLLFCLGLEFSLRKLIQVGPTSGLIAVVETSVMMAFGYGAAQLLGWTPMESVFCGAIVAISSTTIIVKAFDEQKVRGRFTEVVFGVLISEDLIAILLIAILTTVAAGGSVSLESVSLTAGRLALFLVAFVGIGLLTVPRLVRRVVELDRDETILIVALGICFAGALLAVRAGYSVALGAFIAGSLVAESGESHRVTRLVSGVRDMFGAIFFVSVGMIIDPRLIMEHWLAVAMLTAVVICGKFLAVSTGAFLVGNDVRTSAHAGLSMTQIGEFAFIIAALGLSVDAVREFLYPVAVAVSALTTLTTPLLIRASGTISSSLDKHLPRPLQTFVGLYGSWIEHMRAAPADAGMLPELRKRGFLLAIDVFMLAAIVIGTSLVRGAIEGYLGRVSEFPPYAARILVYVPAIVLSAPFFWGILKMASGIASLLAYRALPVGTGNRLDYAQAPRRVLVATLQLAFVTVSGAVVLAVTGPFVPLGRGALVLASIVGWLGVVFWRTNAELYGHTRAGAEIVLAALSRSMAPEREGLAETERRDLATMHRLLPGLGDPVPLRLEADSPAVGRTLGELQLRSQTGAVVLAITRGEERVMLPVGGERLCAGDVMALAGTSEAISMARELLGSRSGRQESAGDVVGA